MASKQLGPDIEAMFVLCTTWIPKNQVKTVEKELKLCLYRSLFKMNQQTRKNFNIKSATETRDKK